MATLSASSTSMNFLTFRERRIDSKVALAPMKPMFFPKFGLAHGTVLMVVEIEENLLLCHLEKAVLFVHISLFS